MNAQTRKTLQTVRTAIREANIGDGGDFPRGSIRQAFRSLFEMARDARCNNNSGRSGSGTSRGATTEPEHIPMLFGARSGNADWRPELTLDLLARIADECADLLRFGGIDSVFYSAARALVLLDRPLGPTPNPTTRYFKCHGERRLVDRPLIAQPAFAVA